MRLRKKQSLFVQLLPKLFVYAELNGWELTLGEGYIDLERVREVLENYGFEQILAEVYGHKLSGCHPLKLAQDLNLFIRGRWISDGSHPAWRKLGLYWRSLHSLCRWLGPKDANHFSLFHDGRA